MARLFTSSSKGNSTCHPPPGWFHQEILTNLADIFLHYLREKPIGRVYFAPFDTYLTDLNVFQPDLIFISNGRRNILKEEGVSAAPDFVVEILSPRTARYDRGPKREVYARTGVEELWLIDPKLKEIQVFQFATSIDKPVATHRANQQFATPTFPGLTVSVADVFQALMRRRGGPWRACLS